MRVFRASLRPRTKFNPLDSSASVARDGWRFNDRGTEILYAAAVEALAILEVAVRPGWETVQEISVACIEVPDASIAKLEDLDITLPTNWNVRPAARDAQRIGREFLEAVDKKSSATSKICGVYVPSVISSSDFNVLLDPRQSRLYKVANWTRIPFQTLRNTDT